MKLLLINPKSPESFWSFKWALGKILPDIRSLNPPLALATVAGLTPPDWQVEIVDENVETVPVEPEADVIGIGGMAVQFERQRELLSYYGKKGYFTVAGGSYASLCPEAYRGLAGTVISGEAEYTWPRFCLDFAAGRPQELYREKGVVDLAHSAVPRFDLLPLNRYHTATLQFSRGCPYRCEFCDIIVMFGRKPRTKPLQLIAGELDALRTQGVHNLFFVDDNLIGNKRRAKELLEFLIEYQRRHRWNFYLGTQVSLNIAGDDELLDLFRRAHFQWVFIGIESPSLASLQEAGKSQNAGYDVPTAVAKIHSYGLQVIGGFIIGFDHDTTSIFADQYDLIMRSGIQSAMIGLLTAVPKTLLYSRLQKEDRLLADIPAADNSKLETNVLPKGMSYEEMVEGYRRLYLHLYRDAAIAAKIRNKFKHFRPPAVVPEYKLAYALTLLVKILARGILAGGPRRIFHFLRSLPFARARLLPWAVGDWVVALATRDFLSRHFALSLEEEKVKRKRLAEELRRSLSRYVAQGIVRISHWKDKGDSVNLAISIMGPLDGHGLRQVARQVERLLKNSRSLVELHISYHPSGDLAAMKKFLAQLAKHGDRILIRMDEAASRLIPVDSSVFNLVF